MRKVPGLDAGRFTGENVINPVRVIKGSPEEQLAQVTALLKGAKESSEEAVADVKAVAAVNKGVLLAYAKQHELWKHSTSPSFEEWGAAVLEVSVKYVHRLVREAAALAKVVAVNERCEKVHHRVSRPSHAVVVAKLIDQHGEEAAVAAIPKAHDLAAEQRRNRPTAALFVQAAGMLGYEITGLGEDGDDDPPALDAPPAVVRAQKSLGRLTTTIGGVKERHISTMSRGDADTARAQAEAARNQLSAYIRRIDKVYPKKSLARG
ncbi:hypothetical protein [Streptomyces sp. NPDC051173]|uniref:hypothetical protein n=1 Tax=Streptomyces sp. NPDC051173 TaxID=3155164 RepID=UPI00344E1AD3